MRYKMIIVLTILLVSLLTVSAVSATDNTTSDVLSIDETTDEVLSVEENQEILKESNDVGTFDELSGLIKNAAEGSVLELDKDYQNVNGSDKILIDKSITINGNGHTLDGCKKSGMFTIKSSNVVLKNINFVNAFDKSRVVSEGGAIYWYGKNGTLCNCSFMHCEAFCSDFDEETEGHGYSYGGAVSWRGSYGNLHDCSFIDTSANSYTEPGYTNQGGAVYWNGANGALSNCSFVSSATDQGGAVYWNGANGALSNCSFANVLAIYDGGAVYWNGANGALSNCSFVESMVFEGDGSAIYWHADKGITTGCSFANSTESEGCTVYWEGAKGTLSNCSFVNTSTYYEDLYTVYWVGVDGTLFNCIFNGDYYNYESYCYAYHKFKPRLTLNVSDTEDGLNILVNTQELIHDLTVHVYNLDDGSFDEQINISSRDNLTQKFIVNDLSYGKYIISLNYPGDKLYLESSTNTTFYNQDIVINVSSINVNYNDDSELVATLVDTNGNPVVGLSVVLTLDETNYSLITNSAGQIKFPTKNLTVGNHPVMISFNGKYNSSSASANVTVNKLDTVLTASDVTMVYNDGKDLVVVLKDADGKVISGAKVTVKVGDVTKTLTTDKNGQVSLSLNGITPDTYTATITFDGDNIYAASNASAKVTINKQKAKIFLRNALYFVLQTKMVKVTLWDGNNNPIAGKTVYIKLDQYTWKYYGVTDENGTATIKVGVGFGTHGVTVGFDGDENYTGTSKTGKIRVIKETPSLMLPGAYTKFKAADKTKTIKVYLKDRYNKPLLPGTKVFVTINGHQYAGAIDSQGIASISINLNKAGVYNVDLYYTGNTAYNAVRKTTKITIV